MCKCSGKCGCNITSTTKGEKGDASSVASLGYKVYTALLTQSGTSAPTATVLQNTLGGVPAYSYITPGAYSIDLNGMFVLGKTIVLIGSGDNAVANSEFVASFDSTTQPNKIAFTTTKLSSGVSDNGCLYNTALEIRVYP